MGDKGAQEELMITEDNPSIAHRVTETLITDGNYQISHTNSPQYQNYIKNGNN